MLYKSNFIHDLYKLTGRIFCRLFLLWCWIHDHVNPPKEDAILFVAHPDDDTLFFHTFIKKYKPYVCLLTTGWSLRRIPGFIMNMKRYGVHYRFYYLETNDTRIELLNTIVANCLKISNFNLCATHNNSGEYGHEMHKKVHNAVIKQVKCNVFVPVNMEEINEYPIQLSLIHEKEEIFKKYYNTELFVLDQYRIWIECEYLKRI